MGFLNRFKRRKDENKKKVKEGSPLWLLLKKSESLILDGKLDEAITIINKIIDLAPDFALAHLKLGDAYEEKGLTNAAITAYKKTIDLDPSLSAPHINLGFTYHKMGLLEKAISEYKNAIYLDPNNALTHSNLGNVYLHKGFFNQAKMEYKLSIELDTNLPEPHFNLAVVYFRSRQYNQAWKHMRTAEKLGMPAQNINQLITALARVSAEPYNEYAPIDKNEKKGSRQELESEEHRDTRRALETYGRWQVGDLINNRFKVLRILKGGMGVVYICEDPPTVLAVKTYQDKYLEDEAAKRLFFQEASTWVRLEEHKNIVRAYLVLKVAGKPYIFLEYIPPSADGKSNLRDHIPHLGIVEALNFAVQFCDGMIYANCVELDNGVKGIVHRDIKPENIMITPDTVLKITDFGLVKAVDEAVEGLAGTPPYMSPEQFMAGIAYTKRIVVDTRSDIYSFGVVLYEMLTGEKPFKGPGLKEYANQHMHQKPKPPRQINPNIPRELENIVLKCLEKMPEKRYQSFKDLRRALEEVYFKTSGKRVTVDSSPSYDAITLQNQGSSLCSLGLWDKGISKLELALKLDPNCVNAHINLGQAYKAKGWNNQAIVELKRAIELDPNNAMAHMNLGALYLMIGQVNQAIVELKRAIELDPNNAMAHMNLGGVYELLGWLDQAILEHKQAIELYPNYAPAHGNLGNAYRKRGMLDQAIVELKRAIELYPGLPVAHASLGLTYAKMGRLNDAISEFKRAIESDPNNTQGYSSRAHFNLAIAYLRLRRFDLAWKHTRLAEKLGMPPQEIERLIADLGKVSTEP